MAQEGVSVMNAIQVLLPHVLVSQQVLQETYDMRQEVGTVAHCFLC